MNGLRAFAAWVRLATATGSTMDIERFKQQHRDILSGINTLRTLTKSGVAENAGKIADGIASLSREITLHLAIEDRILYPMLQNSNNAALARMGEKYQSEMSGIATPFIAFTRQWSTPAALKNDPEGFRVQANIVLKRVYDRMRQEDTEFYPAIEAA